jgi:NADH-quinone oxidoreductase subunit K
METGIAPLLGPALGLSAILFTLGVTGVLLRRNVIVLFVCIELMLNAVNLSFVALAQLHGIGGQVMVFFVMTVAAAEAAVGLAIILAIFRHKQTVDLQNINLLRG